MKRTLLAVLVVALMVAAYWPVKAFLIYRYGESELSVGASLVLQRLGIVAPEPALPPVASRPRLTTPPRVELDDSFVPFREIGERLGPRARSNGMLMAGGLAIFDANGDGRLDLYFPHRGRTVAKATRDNVLTDQSVPAKPGALYLNLGNDDRGDPIYRAVQDLQVGANDRYVREELLIENKYRPRASLADDELAPGRLSLGAVAADFNGDGRLDLYVFSHHYGLVGTTHELGFRVYPARNNLGRGARDARDAVVVRFPSFLWRELEDGLDVSVDLGPDGSEPEGRNTLFLNLGDRDGDGMPEWEDATERTGVGGRWASTSVAVADFDRDGDLDLYVANFLDPDYWGFGTTYFAGNRNQLYVNLLAETGELRFRDAAAELGVAGLHVEENLTANVWLPGEQRYHSTSLHVVDGEQVGEQADHSWAALFTDFNQDGWPDLLVANDISNRLRVYQNLEGRGFRYFRQFEESQWDGCWMGMSVGDLDGDLGEEIFVTNCGSQVMSIRNNALFIEDSTEANLQALLVLNYLRGKSTSHHVVLRPGPDGFRDVSPQTKVAHSPYIPPDLSVAANFAPMHLDLFERHSYGDSVTAYEFAWNAPMFDVDNDGDLDLYLAGSLQRGNDNFVGDWSGSPGRLLVNESAPGRLAFRDRTLEYRLLDIAHLDYDSNPPRRPGPGTGWHKRDYIYLTDTDGYAGMGLDASNSATHDLFRLHEAANGVLAADLNDDGAVDLVLTHAAGYNSTSPEARNLKVAFAGRILAVPAPNKVMKPPTSFEEGRPFVYINSGPPRDAPGHWVTLRLSNPDSLNRFGVGARVVANGRHLRHALIGGSVFGEVTSDLHLGLGPDGLRTLEVTWPDGPATPQRVEFDPPVRDRRVCVDRSAGLVPCERDAADPPAVAAGG